MHTHLPRQEPAPPAVANGGTDNVQGWGRVLAESQAEAVTATFWCPSGLPEETKSVLIRFHGRRVDAGGRPEGGDRFREVEVVEGLPPGAGPFSVTTKARDVNPGEWTVSAEMYTSTGRGKERGRAQARPQPLQPALWSWRRWALSTAPAVPLRTGLAVFGRVPGVIVGIWPTMVTLGVILGLSVLGVVARHEHLRTGPALAASGVAILAGGVGAKLYYMALHRRERRFEGWCLQGFLLATVATLIVGLVVAQVPVRPFLDAAAPGLLMGMAVGRLGCFFAGCCMGRPTASRWGIWSSDRRVGTRRIPTQLLESGLALAIGLITLVVVLSYQPPVAGALFLASISAYTILRQGVLLLRAERRRTSYAGAITSAVAGAALLASVLVLALA